MTVTFNGGAGASVFQQQLYSEAMLYLSKYDGMGQVLNALVTTDLNINFVYNGNDSYNPGTNTISWDPTSALNVVQANGQVGAQSAALGLFHEISHWLYAHTGNPLYAEFSATNFETQAAISLGEVIRPSYSAVYAFNPYVVINNPTAHSGGGYWQAIDVNGNPIVGSPYTSNSTIVSIAGGPTGAPGSTTGGGTGSGAGGGGEHGGTPGGGTGTTVGTGLGDTSGGGGSGGGHWQYPVQLESVHIGPYDTAVVQYEQPVVIVGAAELSHI
ncbi:hypothetical protein ACXZ1M_04470 [Duganella sp. PWIR1]